MSSTATLPATQRAYTLRLTGHPPSPSTNSPQPSSNSPPPSTNWHSRLWHTHLAVNRGTAAFGEWLLAMRGGLDHRLADMPALTQDQIKAELEALTKTATKNNRAVPSPA
ncbi:MAG: hypothetical protein ABSH20_30865, partial [Tepidisphaeraceae bacterium]